MPKTLILFAHPALERSRVHRRLVHLVPDTGVTFHDLYERYPDFSIDVEVEQKLLLDHDLIVLQHPFFWYSTPPMIKQWEDLVLEHGWAYGSSGTALRGKRALSLISTGGRAEAYEPDGYNRFTIRQFLAPIEQTVRLCGMEYLPPYVIHGTHRMSKSDIEVEAGKYSEALRLLAEDRIDLDQAMDHVTLNDAIVSQQSEGWSR